MATVTNDTGMYEYEEWLCTDKTQIRSRGIFFNENPLEFSLPILYAQLATSALFTAIFQLFLSPLGESAFFSQMLTGIVIGPLLWGGGNPILGISAYINQTFALFGCTLFVFLIGVKTDLSMIRRTGRKAVIIGVLSFVVPLTINTTAAAILRQNVKMNADLHNSLYFVAAFLSLNSFHVVVCLLTDLNLLNSELGRLATSASLVSGIFSWIWVIVIYTFVQSSLGTQQTVIRMFLSIFCLAIFVAYVCRPIMMKMVRHTLEEKSIKEDHIMTIFLMILGCLFISEIIGQHMIIGPMFLGMATPDGPPLGSALVSKLDSYVSTIILPSYFAFTGADVKILDVDLRSVAFIEVMSILNFLAKLLATVLPSLYCEMPPLDAITLGLVMSSQGITDVLILQQAKNLHIFDHQTFSIMSATIVLLTGITTPIVKYLYKPSKRYVSHRRRTLEHAHPQTELRILAGIYSQYQTPSIINLLELSNPTPKSPICFYVVHLLELAGRSAPLLITHRPDRKTSLNIQGSEHMIHAFRLYEESNEGNVIVNLFTAVSPYVTMHDEVCGLALEKRVSLVIIPFHKQWSSTTEIEELPRPIRSVNQQILQNAPCSVGILVDRGTLTGTSSLSSKNMYNIGMIFLGGPDDREALAYVMRMGEHPNISVSVTRLVDSNRKRREGIPDQLTDERMINDFRIAHVGKKHHDYKEEFVGDSVETVGVIRSMEKSYDLILVGRRHDNNSPLFSGLTEWSEFPELGFLGDMLASSDAGCEVSVLVVQQQTFSKHKHGDDTDGSVYFIGQDQNSYLALDMPPNYNTNRVFPM